MFDGLWLGSKRKCVYYVLPKRKGKQTSIHDVLGIASGDIVCLMGTLKEYLNFLCSIVDGVEKEGKQVSEWENRKKQTSSRYGAYIGSCHFAMSSPSRERSEKKKLIWLIRISQRATVVGKKSWMLWMNGWHWVRRSRTDKKHEREWKNEFWLC